MSEQKIINELSAKVVELCKRIKQLQAVVDRLKQEMWDCEHNEDFMGHDSAYPKQHATKDNGNDTGGKI